jgi:hypothetical protein
MNNWEKDGVRIYRKTNNYLLPLILHMDNKESKQTLRCIREKKELRKE